jgi:hypothetical protein
MIVSRRQATSSYAIIRRGRREFRSSKNDDDRKPTTATNCVNIRRGDERSFKADDDRKPTVKRRSRRHPKRRTRVLAGNDDVVSRRAKRRRKKNAKRKTRISGQAKD